MSELPRDVARREPFEGVGELNIILNYIVRSGGLRYLDELVAAGELPLRYHPKDVPRLLAALRAAGRDADEIRRILRSPAGGTS